jgi:hypothetical protein
MTPEEQKAFDETIRKVETRFRIETYLMKIGASEASAKLLASSDEAKKFVYDGVDLRFGKSDLTAADDPNARAHFLDGPFKGLFAVAVAADHANGDGDTQVDDADVALARAGNITAKGRILRALNGDDVALGKVLAVKRAGDDTTALNGHGHDKSTNPFIGLRDKSGKIVPEKMKAVESLLRAVGTAKCAAIAKSAGLRLDGTPIPEQYL